MVFVCMESSSKVEPLYNHRCTKEQDWKREPEVHINSLSAILYIVGSYSFCNQGKVLMSGFHDGFAYKSPYIVGLFRYTHRILSGNNTTTSDLRQRETRTFMERSYAEIVRSQKGTLRANELGSEGFFPAASFQ